MYTEKYLHVYAFVCTFLGVRVKFAANFNPGKCAPTIKSLGNSNLRCGSGVVKVCHNGFESMISSFALLSCQGQPPCP